MKIMTQFLTVKRYIKVELGVKGRLFLLSTSRQKLLISKEFETCKYVLDVKIFLHFCAFSCFILVISAKSEKCSFLKVNRKGSHKKI